jgi:hypothetical protein
LIFLSAQEATK